MIKFDGCADSATCVSAAKSGLPGSWLRYHSSRLADVLEKLI